MYGEIRDIPGFEGKYGVTKDGRVWSYRKKGFLIGSISKEGYHRVLLRKDGKNVNMLVHRCVMLAWAPNDDPEKTEVNHKDENKLNNHLDNLEWVSHAENLRYGTRTERAIRTRIQGSKIIGKYDEKGNLLETYESQTAAAAANEGVWQSNLSNSIKTGHKCGGYYWNYIDEEEI